MADLNRIQATKQHIRLLGRTCRVEDRASMRAAGAWADPAVWARAQVNRSLESWAFFREGFFMGLAGVIELPRQLGRPPGQFLWTACEPECLSREFVEELRDRHPLLIAMVHGRDAKLLDAVGAAGFSLMAPAPFGKAKDLFVKCGLDTRKIEVARG